MAHWMSVKQMSEAGYGSRNTIYQHIARGDFKCGNPGGGKWLIDLDSYEEWLERERSRPRHRRKYRFKRR